MYYDHRNMPELIEGTHIKGWLDLTGSKLTHLPNNLTIDYSLILNKSSIQELPENLSVGYELYLVDTAIKKIPDSLTFNKNPDGILGFIVVKDLSSMTYPPKLKRKVVSSNMIKNELYGRFLDKKNKKDIEDFEYE